MQSLFKALFWMFGWLACMVTMAVAGRELTNELPVFVVMFLRSLIALAFLTPYVLWRGWPTIRSDRPGKHLIRNIVHYAGQYSWFFAISLIPIAQVISIEFTLPIWTAIIAVLFLGEKLNAMRVLSIFMGFAGVLLIIRPGITEVEVGQIFALCAALGFAVAVTMTKSLTRHDSAFTCIFYMLLVQTVLGCPPALAVWTWPSVALWPWVFVVAFIGSASHYCMARAFVHADAMIVIPMDFLRVPLSALAGYLLYREGIDIWLAIGATLILAGNVLNLTREGVNAKRQ